MSTSSDLALAYLENMRAAQESGQPDHVAFLLKKAMEWLSRHDRERARLATPVQLEIGIGLHTGIREKNEDYVFAHQTLCNLSNGTQETVGLFVLADGAGGHSDGQQASSTAVHAFVDEVYPHLVEAADLQASAIKNLLVGGMRVANEAVCLRKRDPRSMVTTMTAGLTVGAQACIASVGDSRAYLYRQASGLKQLTRDHSHVASLVEEGKLSPQEVYSHPKRNVITRSLGHPHLQLDEPVSFSLQDRDRLLFCSDGLWEMVRDPEAKAIEAILASADAEASEMAEALVELALMGGGHDNIGLLVVKAGISPIEDIDTIILGPAENHLASLV